MSTPITISTKPTDAQVAAILDAGPGASVHHPHASLPGRRRQLGQALGRAGVPHRLVRSLAWTTKGPVPKAAEEPAQASETSASEPDPEDTLVERVVG